VRRVLALGGLSAGVVLVALLSFWIGLWTGSQTGTVSGHVYSWICGHQFKPSSCNGPYVGAVVRFEPTNGGQVYKVSSNASGAFSVSLPSGTYVIKQEWLRYGTSGSYPYTNDFDVGPHQLAIRPGEHISVDLAVAIPGL
jgi:hypothetical protein